MTIPIELAEDQMIHELLKAVTQEAPKGRVWLLIFNFCLFLLLVPVEPKAGDFRDDSTWSHHPGYTQNCVSNPGRKARA